MKHVKTYYLTPARAGSKGIPHKNTRLFAGLPLVLHAVRIGLKTCSETLVSTDDLQVAQMCGMYGGRVLMRPAELAQDDTPMLPVVDPKPDVVVLLQPTSPLRKVWHVAEALRLIEDDDVSSVVSVLPIPAHRSPDYAMQLVGGRWLQPARADVTRRQDCRPAYYRDGTVYAIRRWVIEDGGLYGPQCVPLVIPAEESATLDTESDWALAEAKYGRVHEGP